MSGPLPIRVVTSAATAIREAAEWWAANRLKAPDAFSEELKRAFQLVASHPVSAREHRTFFFQMFDGFILLGFTITYTIEFEQIHLQSKSWHCGIQAEAVNLSCSFWRQTSN